MQKHVAIVTEMRSLRSNSLLEAFSVDTCLDMRVVMYVFCVRVFVCVKMTDGFARGIDYQLIVIPLCGQAAY